MTTAKGKPMPRHPLPFPCERVVEAVVVAIADQFNVQCAHITGRAQYDGIADIRALAFYLCHDLSDATHAQIGQRFSGRTRWTASDGARRGEVLAAREMHRQAAGARERVLAALEGST